MSNFGEGSSYSHPELFPDNILSGTSLSGLSTNIILEKYFAGTFDGGISTFHMYAKPLSVPEIQHNARILYDQFDLLNPYCLDCEVVDTDDFTFEFVPPLSPTPTPTLSETATNTPTPTITPSVTPSNTPPQPLFVINNSSSNDTAISNVVGNGTWTLTNGAYPVYGGPIASSLTHPALTSIGSDQLVISFIGTSLVSVTVYKNGNILFQTPSFNPIVGQINYSISNAGEVIQSSDQITILLLNV